jgi:ribose transport system permease protein
VYFLVAPSFRLISRARCSAQCLPAHLPFVLALIASRVAQLAIGRHIYGLGSNETAVKLSGSASSGRSSPTGLRLWRGSSGSHRRLNSAQPAAGMSYELDAISAAVIGGASLSGGEGTILGTMIGALIMGVLKNGLNLMNVSQFWQQVAMGIVVIGAVYLDIVRRRRS